MSWSYLQEKADSLTKVQRDIVAFNRAHGIVAGYTIAFGPVSDGWIGGGAHWLLSDLGTIRPGTTIPESTFALFQMTFAVITPALMIGAWVERARGYFMTTPPSQSDVFSFFDSC